MKKKVEKNTEYKISEPTSNVVNESLVTFQANYDFALNHPIERIEMARKGIKKSKLIALAQKMDISVAELADILHISLRTIQRYDDNDLLDTHTSEHIMLIDNLYQTTSLKVFNNTNQFCDWMKLELFDFNFKKPISLLDTYSGVEIISDKLGQFQHGVFA